MFPLLKNDKKSAFLGEYDKGYYGRCIRKQKNYIIILIIKSWIQNYFILTLIIVRTKYGSFFRGVILCRAFFLESKICVDHCIIFKYFCSLYYFILLSLIDNLRNNDISSLVCYFFKLISLYYNSHFINVETLSYLLSLFLNFYLFWLIFSYLLPINLTTLTSLYLFLLKCPYLIFQLLDNLFQIAFVIRIVNRMLWYLNLVVYISQLFEKLQNCQIFNSKFQAFIYELYYHKHFYSLEYSY